MERRIVVFLPEPAHVRLRVAAALERTSVRAYAAVVLAKAVKDVSLPEQ